jgi:chromosome segregation ATPase
LSRPDPSRSDDVTEDEPKLVRSVFGYTSRSITRLLDEQEARYGARIQSQARMAQQRAADLQGQLDSAKAEIEALTEELQSKERARAGIEAELRDAAQALRDEKEQIGFLRRSVSELALQIKAASDVVDHGKEAVASMANLEAELAAAKDELRMKALETWSTDQENTKLRDELSALKREQLLKREREPRREIVTDPPAQQEPAEEDPVAKLVAREMSNVLDSAVTDVVQQVRRSSVEQLEEAERLRRETRAELEQLAALRRATAPLISSVQVGMQRAQARIEELPNRVADALAPLTESLDALVVPIRGLADVMREDPDLGPHGSDPSASDETPTIEIPESEQIGDATNDDAETTASEDGSSESWSPHRWPTRPE